MNHKGLIAYAQQYTSFLLFNLKLEDYKLIKEIILFGSVARGEATKDSDVDIFVNLFKESKKLEKEIDRLTKKFYETEFWRSWKLMGVTNDLKPMTGILDQWKLKASVIANGIMLYGKYQRVLSKGAPYVIIYWDKVRPEGKRVFLSKKLYGYTQKGKPYKGLIPSEVFTKLSANCIIVPLDYAQTLLHFFKDMKICYRTIYVGKM